MAHYLESLNDDDYDYVYDVNVEDTEVPTGPRGAATSTPGKSTFVKENIIVNNIYRYCWVLYTFVQYFLTKKTAHSSLVCK